MITHLLYISIENFQLSHWFTFRRKHKFNVVILNDSLTMKLSTLSFFNGCRKFNRISHALARAYIHSVYMTEHLT